MEHLQQDALEQERQEDRSTAGHKVRTMSGPGILCHTVGSFIEFTDYLHVHFGLNTRLLPPPFLSSIPPIYPPLLALSPLPPW